MNKTYLATLLALVLPVTANAQSVPIVFDLPPDINSSNVHVQFLNTSGVITGNYRDVNDVVQSLTANTSYAMSALTSPTSVGGGAPSNKPAVLISNFVSGRVYINFGPSGLAGLGGTYQPDANSPGDTNYTVRYQYLEPTIVGAQANVNLSYIDFAAIPLSMEAVNAPNAQNNPQHTPADGQALIDATAATSIIPSNNVLPSPVDILPSTNFARVIAPQLSGTLYHDWTNYLQNTLQNSTSFLVGIYFGTGAQPSGNPKTQAQSYDFEVTFNALGDALLVAQPGSGDGYSAAVPAVQQGPGVGDTNRVIIAFTNLNAITGIYGNNPPYTIIDGDTTNSTIGIVNDFFGRVVGDLLAGLSWGFCGSTVDFMGTAIADLSSTEWWGGKMPDGTTNLLADTPAGQGFIFGKAQPGQPHNYHSYAAALDGHTTGYGFPLQDRMNNNLLAFNTTTDPGSYLLITINPDLLSPTLYIQRGPGAAILRWTSQASSFQLTSAPIITNTNWTAVAETPVAVGDDLVVTNAATNAVDFYRLER